MTCLGSPEAAVGGWSELKLHKDWKPEELLASGQCWMLGCKYVIYLIDLNLSTYLVQENPFDGACPNPSTPV